MITVLTGKNWYRIKSELDAIVRNFRTDHDDLAVERINGPEASLADIFGAVSGVSLFAADKLVVITDLSANKEAVEKIEKITDSVAESTWLVLVESVVDKRSVYYKFLKKLDNFSEFNELSEEALASWAVDYVLEFGGILKINDARYLIERVGPDQTLLERELTKLFLYDKNISKETINSLTEETPSSTVFNLVEAAFRGDVKGALKLYDEQRALRKEPQAIYGMIVWQMHLVAVAAAAGNKGTREIAADTGLNSYSLGKAQIIARNMGATKIQEFLKLLRDIEITSKRQTYDFDEAMKYAITRLAY